jgi:sugar-specific transcriptional regulator TrmB
MIEQILMENGLTKKESVLYLSVLEAGETTLAHAAEKAHLKRSTVYSLVDGMKERGFLSETKRRGIGYISALSPRLLIERFERSLESAKTVLPQLMDLAYASPVKPRIRFYDGMEGIKQILFDAAASGRDYIGFIDYALMPKEIYKHIRTKVAPERAKLGNNLQLLMPRNETNAGVLKDYRQMIEHRMVDFPSRKNHIEILLYEGSKIGCMSFVKNEMFGVVIDSEAIFVTLKDLFTLIWEQA